jgi:hypothetical protein
LEHARPSNLRQRLCQDRLTARRPYEERYRVGIWRGAERSDGLDQGRDRQVTCALTDQLCLQQKVILAVDPSYIAVGFVLLQLGVDEKRYLAQFESIS